MASASNSPSWNGTNASGFTALPAGYRDPDPAVGFRDLGSLAYFWSATEYSAPNAWARFLSTGDWQSYRYYPLKTNGISVRCLRN